MLVEYEFPTVGAAIQFLIDTNWVFKVDPDTKNDLYVLENRRSRHYTIKEKDNHLYSFFLLKD